MRTTKSGPRNANHEIGNPENQVNFSAEVDKEHTEKVEALQVASLLL